MVDWLILMIVCETVSLCQNQFSYSRQQQ